MCECIADGSSNVNADTSDREKERKKDRNERILLMEQSEQTCDKNNAHGIFHICVMRLFFSFISKKKFVQIYLVTNSCDRRRMKKILNSFCF